MTLTPLPLPDHHVAHDPAHPDGHNKIVDALAALMGVRYGNRWVALGDSTTAGSVDNVNHALGDAWPVYASMISKQSLHLVRDSGVFGNQTSDMIARFATDVAAYAPTLVTILTGTNDYANAVPLSTYQSGVRQLVSMCQKIGARPVLCTILPRDVGGYQATIDKWNAWLRRYADTAGLAILDMYRQVADPTNGHYLAAYFTDGVHPNAIGHGVLGAYVAQTLAQWTPPGGPMLPLDQVDTNNMLLNPLFINGGPIPTSWTPGTAPSGVVKSLVVDSAVPGQMFQAVCTASSGVYVLQPTPDITTGFSPGDTLACTGICTSSGGVTAQCKVTMNGNTTVVTPMFNLAASFTRGVFYLEFVVPATAASLRIQIQAGTGTGTVAFGQMGLYNLSAMGI